MLHGIGMQSTATRSPFTWPLALLRRLLEASKDAGGIKMDITLKEYAFRHGRTPATVRQKVLRGGFKTAHKMGRDWLIDENEPYIKRPTRNSRQNQKAKDEEGQWNEIVAPPYHQKWLLHTFFRTSYPHFQTCKKGWDLKVFRMRQGIVS